ncbi:unnamed protein product [Orchesella dallaii]|uniref:Extended synaptotagmin-2 n=1 Tax=Orchesella dallaii TaxID=48710 RepID=A0ABP1QLC1_9HEXA
MGSFRFEKVILGDTPVRVRGVKVYDEKKTDRNEIIMDMEVIYAGDCDVRFSLSKIRAGIKDLQLHGTLRLVMKPLVNQMPLIGGIQYFFLNPPSLDFNLIGVADVLDMPGLADLIRRIVQEQIAAMCVLPNKMFVQLAENVNAQETCALKPQGVIRICAIEARNLLKKDVGVLGMGKSDPYVVLSVGAQSFKSKIINNTVTPKWDFHCEMMVEEIGQNLIIYVYDYDEMPRQDEFLGRTSVDLSLVRREGTMDVWLDLEDVRKGQIHLKLTWLGFSENPVDLKSALLESQNHGLASCMLTVRLDSAKNLPVVHRKAGLQGIHFGKNTQTVKEGHRPDPYAILSVGKVQHESTTMEKTSDPVFEETMHFLVRNPLTDTLLVKLMDRKTSFELGTMKQSLDLVFGRAGMIMEKQRFTLNTRSEAKVTLDMQLKILKHGIQGNEEDLDDEIQLPDDTNTAPAGDKSAISAPPTPPPAPADPDTVLKRSPSVKQPSIQSIHEDVIVKQEESRPLLAAIPGQVGSDDDKNMKIRMTIRYSQTTHQLIVVVHSVANLPIEQEELPDPYVKLYVLPERNKKHKTEAVKDQCNPLYDERFEFPIIDLRGKTLEVTVCDKKYIRSSPKLGDVLVALDDFQTGNSVTNWYPLVE